MDNNDRAAKLQRLEKLKRLKELRDLKAKGGSLEPELSLPVVPQDTSQPIIPAPSFGDQQTVDEAGQLKADLQGGDDTSGFKRGLLDVGQGAKQLALNTTPKGAQEYTDSVNKQVADYEKSRGIEQGAFDIPRLAGNAAALMPLALTSPGAAMGIGGRMAANALIGAGAGLASFDPTNTFGNKSKQVIVGGVGGAVLPEAAGLVAKKGTALGSALINKTKRVPSSVVQEASRTGQPQLVTGARKQLNKTGKVDLEALRRKALYERLDLDHTSAQVSRDPAQWQLEAELAKSQNNPNLRNALISGNKQLINKVDDIAEGISPQAKTPYELGSNVDDAITKIDKKLQGKVTKAYNKAGDAVGVDDVADTDLFAARIGEVYDKYEDQINKISVIDKRIKDFLPSTKMTKEGAEEIIAPVKNLTVKEGERAIKLINERLGELSYDKKSAKNALMGLSRSIRDTLDDMGQLSDEAAPLFAKARSMSSAKFKAESPSPIKNMLNGKTSSDDFMKKHVLGGKVDELNGMVNYLSKSGQGKEVLNDIRAETVRHLLSKGTQGNGVEGEFKGRLFKKATEAMRDKLNVLFRPDEVKMINDIAQAGFDMTSQPAFSYVNNSNTSSALVNALQSKSIRGNVPMIGDFLEDKLKSKITNDAIGSALSGNVVNPGTVTAQDAARSQLINRLSRGATIPAIPALHKELGR